MILIRAERHGNEPMNVRYELEGDTDTLMAEIAAGTAGALLALADDLPAQDELHESLARVVCGMIMIRVDRELTRRANVPSGKETEHTQEGMNDDRDED